MSEPGSGQKAMFQITHWKAGSTWVQGVLRSIAKERFVIVKAPLAQVLAEQYRPDGVYGPVYMSRPKFLEAVGTIPHRRVIVIRDLRDTLVSWYFSLRFSHPQNSFVSEQRARFEGMSTEQALISLIDERLGHIAGLQRSWLKSDDKETDFLVRYEELLADEQAGFARILDHLGLEVGDEIRQRVVAANSFENRTGRKKGQEDAGSHQRKGVSGDWRNHFTPAVIEAFRKRFGQHMIDSGYESNLDWE